MRRTHLALDFEDEIADKMCIAHDGEIRYADREALQSAPKKARLARWNNYSRSSRSW